MISYREFSKRGEESLGPLRAMNVLTTRKQLHIGVLKKTLSPVK
jgi:hypothetical protein